MSSQRSTAAAATILAAALSHGCTLHGIKDELPSIDNFSNIPGLSWLSYEKNHTSKNAAQAAATHGATADLPSPSSSSALALAKPLATRAPLTSAPNSANSAPASANEHRNDRRTDLWGRIRRGFRMELAPHSSVQAKRVWFADNPHYVKRVSERAAPYLHYIAENIAQRGLPMELALLPIVESSYRPLAYSSSGAAGLWQIIAPTGRHLGLKQNWWYDGRRDVIDATAAALSYLQELHAEFASWPLALAAYNCGRGTVTRAQARSAALNRDTDYWSIRPLLPWETQDYVPRLLGMAAAVLETESLGLTLATIADAPYFSIVEVGTQLDLGLAAQMANVELAELQRLNPGFKRWSMDPDGPHRLLIPAPKAEGFKIKLAKVPPAKRVTWRRHVTASGENLGQIARRYGTQVNVLKKVNKLRSPFIRAGKTLIVPVVGSTSAATLASAPPMTRSGAVGGSSKTRVHEVRAGNSLWSIARRYDLRVATLVQANPGMSAKKILRPGQKLTIPPAPTAPSRTAPAKRGAAVTASTGAAFTAERARVYTVRVGDSLWSIAQRLGYRVSQLRQWNNLTAKTILKPGQRLNLYPPAAGHSG